MNNRNSMLLVQTRIDEREKKKGKKKSRQPALTKLVYRRPWVGIKKRRKEKGPPQLH